MNQNDIPLGFGFALAQNTEAMERFSALSAERRSEVLQKAHSVTSKQEMKALVNSLTTP